MYSFQNKFKSLASQGGPNAISEDVFKRIKLCSTDTGQSCQPEEPSGASGDGAHRLRKMSLHRQMGDLSASLENLSVTELPEALSCSSKPGLQPSEFFVKSY